MRGGACVCQVQTATRHKPHPHSIARPLTGYHDERLITCDMCVQVMQPLVYGSISAEDREELTPTHFAQLVPLAQCGLDYMLFQANATGQALVGGCHGDWGRWAAMYVVFSATLHGRPSGITVLVHAGMHGRRRKALKSAAQMTHLLTAPSHA
jgi:hypothetical protein